MSPEERKKERRRIYSCRAITVFVLLGNYIWFYFRLLWFILFGFAVWYGYLLYTPFLDAWENEPTVIATDQADFPVQKLPFPGITICSNNKIVYRQLESVFKKQPWKGLINRNYNITQATTDKGMFKNSFSYLFAPFFIECKN